MGNELELQWNPWYAYQFVMNEECKPYSASSGEFCYAFLRSPIIPGTIIGTVYIGDREICKFTTPYDFKEPIDFVYSENCEIRVTGKMNYGKGKLFLTWDREVKDTKVVVSYEYDANFP